MPEVCEAVEHVANHSDSKNAAGNRSRSRRWFLIGGLAVIGAAIGVWHSGVKYRFIAKRFAVVEPGRIYRSGQISRWVIGDVLDEHRIGLIIDLNGKDPNDEHQAAELQAAKSRGIEVKRYPLRGNGTGDIHRYAEALTELHRAVQQGKPVLIHCHAGASRTGAAVAFYRLLVQHRDPADVLEEMSEFKSDLSATQVLIVYMNTHMRTLAELLVQSGVLPRMPSRIPQLCQ